MFNGVFIADAEFTNSDEFEDDGDSDSSVASEEAEVHADAETGEDQAARRAAMDTLVPALDPSDYGKMPSSFYTNSQRIAPEPNSEENTETEASKPENEVPEVRPMRRPVFAKETYDGVDSDDETDEENGDDDQESEEDRPQLVGDIEIDMGEEEEEFLEFSRQALGISDEHWQDILRDRKGRGGKCLSL